MRRSDLTALRFHLREWVPVVALLIGPQLAVGQTVRIDNTPTYPLATAGGPAISLNSLNGNATVRTVNGNLVTCGTVTPGGGSSQAFMVDNAGPYPFAALPGITAISFNSATGNAEIHTPLGLTNCAAGGTGPAPVITSFTATPAAPAQSVPVTIGWTTTNVSSCLASGGQGTAWSAFGILPANGSRQVTSPANNTSVTFTLTCSGNSQQVSKTTTIIVGGGGGTGPCTSPYPISQQILWTQIFNVWPGYGIRRRIIVPYDGYTAFQFTASASSSQFGTVTTSDYPNDGDGFGQMSISREPGCFTPAQLGPNCLSAVARYVSIGWSNGPTAFSCKLTPGQTYWVNLTYGGSVAGPGPYCPAGLANCGADILNYQQD